MTGTVARAVQLDASNQLQLTVLDVREAPFKQIDLAISALPLSRPKKITSRAKFEQFILPIRDKAIPVGARETKFHALGVWSSLWIPQRLLHIIPPLLTKPGLKLKQLRICI